MPEDNHHIDQSMIDPRRRDRAENERIECALEVERLDVNLYRSRSLYVPYRARGVFGGQVISQAIVSATKCVDPAFALHSLHCYFLLSASPAVPIIYLVERLREGKSYTTRSVKASQEGRVVFILFCSYQRPEPWQPSQQWAMPAGVPAPEACELDEERWVRQGNRKGQEQRVKALMLDFADERARSPIRIKSVKEVKAADGRTTYMYWMQAKDIPKYEAPYQKCILSYLSDLRLIGAGARTLGLKSWSQGPDGVGMTSSLDHSIYFYNDNFDCGDWLLYVMESPCAGSGRGVIHGRLFTRTGTLVAVTSQEAVIRANVRAPREAKAKL